MKKSDIATIILIAVLSTLVAYFLANAILGDPNEESVTVEYMNVISSDVEEPDSEVFNAAAINPTVEVIIGENMPDVEEDEDEVEVDPDSNEELDVDNPDTE